MAYDSCPKTIRPTCHHSNGKKEFEDSTARPAAHSNYYYKPFDSCGKSVDVMLESKCKENALIKYRKDFL